MSKKFRRLYETAFDSKISKSDEDLLSADKQDAAIARRLSSQLQLSASTSSVQQCAGGGGGVARGAQSSSSSSSYQHQQHQPTGKAPGRNRLFGFLLHRRRAPGRQPMGGNGDCKSHRSSDSVATSSSLSLESICTSDSLSSHSSESPARCCDRFPGPHVLSPISDKSSLDYAAADAMLQDRERRRSSAAAAVPANGNHKTCRPPQSLGLIKLNDDHRQHHGSDSGISVGSKPGDNYQELLDVPFDMPKLRRRPKPASEVFRVEAPQPPPPKPPTSSSVQQCNTAAAATAATTTTTITTAAVIITAAAAEADCQPEPLLPFDMPKLRRKQTDPADVGGPLPFDMPKLRKRQMDSCARVISLDFEIGRGDLDAYRGCETPARDSGKVAIDASRGEQPEVLPFDIPKLKRINLQNECFKKPDRGSLFLDVKPSNCAAVNTNNRPSLKTFQNKNQPNRPTLSLSNIKPQNFVEDIDVSLPLDQQCWYHGSMNRLEAEKALLGQKEGSYLVRGNKGSYALSIKSAKGFIHMRITQSGGRNYLGQSDRPFDTIPDLIRHYTLNKLPAKGAEHVGLVRPLALQIL